MAPGGAPTSETLYSEKRKREPTGHCGEAHLHRYLAEFEFRYNNRSGLGIEDAERTANAVKGAAGKGSCIINLVKPRTLRQKARKLYRKRKRL